MEGRHENRGANSDLHRGRSRQRCVGGCLTLGQTYRQLATLARETILANVIAAFARRYTGLTLLFCIGAACAAGPTRDLGGDPPGDGDADRGDEDGGDGADELTASDLDGDADHDTTPVEPSASLRRCPTAGTGSILGDYCFVLTPGETGLPATGVNADANQYALRPTGARRGKLLLFLNASGSVPQNAIADEETSFYSVGRAEGLNVLAIAYRASDVIGIICSNDDACFEPTRLSVITGEYVTGGASQVDDITVDEGIYARTASALAKLIELDPSGGWDSFIDLSAIANPSAALRWDKMMVSGHSQGGGHAAMLGKLHATERVVMLASPCDSISGVPATWLQSPAGWATNTATRFYGLNAVNDPICPSYELAWEQLGLPTTATRADAFECPGGGGGHSAAIKCESNAEIWREQLQ